MYNRFRGKKKRPVRFLDTENCDVKVSKTRINVQKQKHAHSDSIIITLTCRYTHVRKSNNAGVDGYMYLKTES